VFKQPIIPEEACLSHDICFLPESSSAFCLMKYPTLLQEQVTEPQAYWYGTTSEGVGCFVPEVYSRVPDQLYSSQLEAQKTLHSFPREPNLE